MSSAKEIYRTENYTKNYTDSLFTINYSFLSFFFFQLKLLRFEYMATPVGKKWKIFVLGVVTVKLHVVEFQDVRIKGFNLRRKRRVGSYLCILFQIQKLGK